MPHFFHFVTVNKRGRNSSHSFRPGYFCLVKIHAYALITGTALLPPYSQRGEASETACRLSDMRQIPDETKTNDVLSGGLEVSQGRVMHHFQWKRKLLCKYIWSDTIRLNSAPIWSQMKQLTVTFALWGKHGFTKWPPSIRGVPLSYLRESLCFCGVSRLAVSADLGAHVKMSVQFSFEWEIIILEYNHCVHFVMLVSYSS